MLKKSKRAVTSYVLIFVMVFSFLLPGNTMQLGAEEKENPAVRGRALSGAAIVEALGVQDEIAQPGGSNQWLITGTMNGWDTTNEDYKLSHLVGEFYQITVVLPAGDSEFKFRKNPVKDDWTGSIGNKDGNNFKVTGLEKDTTVTFYLNDELGNGDGDQGKLRCDTSLFESQGIEKYTPAIPEDEWPRLVGDLQTELGETADWSPSDANQKFLDYYFDNSYYKMQRTLPKGSYSCKAIFGASWDCEEAGVLKKDGTYDNLTLDIKDKSADVTFTFYNKGDKPRELSHNYQRKDSVYDGKIQTEQIYYDSRSVTYKKPFGAVKEASENITFRIAAMQNDAQAVKLELIDAAELSKTYDMNVTTVLDGKDYWEVTVPKEDIKGIGVWGYKFILIDGAAKIEYGDDGISGGTGMVSEEGQAPYKMTVYAADYKTPDWMKNAVVYQIFPDRFFDGDSANNRAKTVDGYRGEEKADGTIHRFPYQYFDGLSGSEGIWSDYPENPRQSEDKYKAEYPDAKTDGQWSNEFYGGDLKGIEKKIGYLKSLGVTAIYLNPVSWAASNHKYDATDYKHLDPVFGEPVYNEPGNPASGLDYAKTKEASDKVYMEFAKACDAASIKLISDGVFNHVGDDSIYFDRYEKYPEIGAYEYWKRVWDTVEKEGIDPVKATEAQKSAAEQKVKADYLSKINPSTSKNYTEADFNFTTWFDVGPDKIWSEDGKTYRYNYEGWWGFDSLPAVKAVTADQTNLTNDKNASIAGAHEYNNVGFRENVIGYDLADKTDAQAEEAMKQANSQRWLYMGSSGWRLDVAPDVSRETWQQFRKSVKSAAGRLDANGKKIDDPIILGEEWNVATNYLLGDQFDSVMNYQFRNALQDYIINGKSAQEFHNALEIIRENYPKEAWLAMLNLVDSHDTVRNITKIDNPGWEEENVKIAPEASERALKLQALTAIFQMSYPGAPTIYYGDETGVAGTKDPDSRRSFPWERITELNGSYSATGRYQELFQIYQKAANIRNQYSDVFAQGEIKPAYAAGDVIAYARKSKVNAGLSAINKSEQPVTIQADVSEFLPNGLVLTDKLENKISGTIKNGIVEITIPAMSGVMMISETELGYLPNPPANVKAEAVNGKNGIVNLTWDSVDGADHYEIYRTLLEGSPAVKIGESSVNAYTDLDVKNGTRYYYYVKTVINHVFSQSSESVSALPSYEITGITKPNVVNDMEIGVGSRTEDIITQITIPGLTDDTAYANEEVPDLLIYAAFYLTSQGKESAVESPLYYQKDGISGDKEYHGDFEPAKAGEYSYYIKASINHGADWIESDSVQMKALPNTKDPIPPKAPLLKQAGEESNRVALSWETEEEADLAGFDILRKTGTGTFIKVAAVDSSERTFTDYTVSNDTTYIYKVEAFDLAYNRTASNEMIVTPKLTMVDVTIRLHIPERVYTSPTDTVYIASGENGWNPSGWTMKKPSGATDNNIVEFTFQMMSGKKIEYKFTRGSWESEALTSKKENDVVSPGNYGYSSTDTNISLTIQNQGNNKMLVNDYVLRWVDMPMMITLPRISYGKAEEGKADIAYTTEESSFSLRASVPMGGIFTINGTDINKIEPGALDLYGNVNVDKIPLQAGKNVFTLHIEPTEETKNQPWLQDKERIKTQMSATKTIEITRTEDSDKPDEKPAPSPDSGTADDSINLIPDKAAEEGQTAVSKKEPQITGSKTIKGWDGIYASIRKTMSEAKKQKRKTTVTIEFNQSNTLPKKILEMIKGENIDLVLIKDKFIWKINGKEVKVTDKGWQPSIQLITDKKEGKAVREALQKQEKQYKEKFTQVTFVNLNQKGKLPGKISVTVPVNRKYNNKKVYISYYNSKTKQLELCSYKKVGIGRVTFQAAKPGYYLATLQAPAKPQADTVKKVKVGSKYKVQLDNVLANAEVKYTISPKSIASISKSGIVTSKNTGSAKIKIQIKQGEKVYSVEQKLNIIK